MKKSNKIMREDRMDGVASSRRVESGKSIYSIDDSAPLVQPATRKKMSSDEIANRVLPRFKIPEFEYTFSSSGKYVFQINCYCIQRWIYENAQCHMLRGEATMNEIQVDYDRFENIIINGMIFFCYNNAPYMYIADVDTGSNVIRSSVDISTLVGSLKDFIKNNNPLREKNVYVAQDGIIMKKADDIKFEDVIIDETIRDDIYDNTIFQLECLPDNNGIILYGVPGTGKSLMASAIVNIANQKGYSTCYITTKVDFSALEEFIYKFLSPCVVILEDIDYMGQSREQTLNTDISTLLQFISGIAEKSDKIIFVATTNYIEHLDKALANRPMRFNRKYEFKLPDDKGIDALMSRYFDEFELPKELYPLCYKKDFTGSHIKEINRTCQNKALKQFQKITPESIKSVFPDSVQIVKNSFHISTKKIGF